MTRMLRLLRKMNVILFLAFLTFSTVFIVLLVLLYNMNWNQLFDSFKSRDLEKTAFLLIDDMRREHIGAGPLQDSQQEWLKRRAILYGVLLRYESKDRKEAWLDTFAKADREPGDDVRRETPYVLNGDVQGTIVLSNMAQKGELDPAFQGFQDMVRSRTKLLIGAVVAAAIVFSLLISRKLSQPLQHVYSMATQIGEGKRDVRIAVRGPEEVRQLAITLNDMTAELKRQEDWRHHLMEDFMHELRTPLTSILSQVEAIVDGLFEPDNERLQDIYDEMVRLSRLVNDLERLSEAEAARFTMNVRRTNMTELVRRVYNNYKALAREKGIRLLFEPTNVPCYAEVDRDKIVQVVTNLVLNAIKYTSGGGTVKLVVDWSEDSTFVMCEDTGIGIQADDLPYIFNRLYRADKSRSRFSGGVGLGLSIAKALVEAHHGAISAVSRVGHGSRFTVQLPNVYTAFGERE
ncbi:ATP-binding protein [Paenibacillus sp. HJGM_3]|uniref:sensor histidine kinase n=1 Tax=Paenibacillus sp. HJGM_3 TaxID=3379816 RepID=UPI00385822A4